MSLFLIEITRGVKNTTEIEKFIVNQMVHSFITKMHECQL